MSSIKRLPEEQRKFIEKLLREDRLTLNEMLDEIRAEFPTATIPSRSALGRYHKNFEDEAREFRKIAAASEHLVKEFGEDPDDKGGMLLAQAVQAVVTKRALDELTNNGDDDENPQMDISDVGALARAARAAIMTKEKAMENRAEVRRQAREELLKEQDENLKKAAASQGMGEDQIQFWREKVLGIK
ncbi:phage protein Gp27 family protein [Acinetobacter sp. WCHAc060025]|uniref:phage protein Gp27 family protein n=1 Tax=Acinetobacter sp. WCHAc060025 TaxID=2518625 RepID=UPI001D18B41A|nr:phage protein Gp27 family protein [Acinetobacter sp. WCHAc060025]